MPKNLGRVPATYLSIHKGFVVVVSRMNLGGDVTGVSIITLFRVTEYLFFRSFECEIPSVQVEGNRYIRGMWTWILCSQDLCMAFDMIFR